MHFTQTQAKVLALLFDGYSVSDIQAKVGLTSQQVCAEIGTALEAVRRETLGEPDEAGTRIESAFGYH